MIAQSLAKGHQTPRTSCPWRLTILCSEMRAEYIIFVAAQATITWPRPRRDTSASLHVTNVRLLQLCACCYSIVHRVQQCQQVIGGCSHTMSGTAVRTRATERHNNCRQQPGGFAFLQ